MSTDELAYIIANILAILIVASPIICIFLVVKYLIQRKKGTPKIKIYKGPFKTGWIWNEETQRWDPPAKIDKSKPTYEEWREQREKASSTEDQTETSSTYRLRGAEIQKDDTIIYSRTIETTRDKTEEQTPFTPPTWNPEYWRWYEPRTESEPRTKRPENKETGSPSKPIPNPELAQYKNAYEPIYIFTKNERNNYKTLKTVTDEKGYHICPKIRLADIIKPRNDQQYMARFGKIKSKHVDFVIFDKNMIDIIAIIELDDSSHDTEERKKRDEFVDFILNDCGIKIIHTRYITPDILDGI